MSDSSSVSSVTLHSVCKRYGEHVQALDDVSLSIEKGQFVALMGPSGCGKSTLLNLVGGIEKPSAGRIIVGDCEVSLCNDRELTALRLQHIGFIFQFFNLLSGLTVRENVE